MALDRDPVTSDAMQSEAYGFYSALTRTTSIAAEIESGGERSLGGRLLYAGQLDTHGRALAIAGNVSGCATLAATADSVAQKQSIRDGVVDFLVTSLDEALRILKNEIRKRNTVAVCVGVAPEAIEREMQERGVQPDLVSTGLPGQQGAAPQFSRGSHEVQFREPDPALAFLTWQVEQSPARWMAKLDAIALDCIDSTSWESRWIRLSPRYLGRSAFALRTLYCDPPTAKQIVGRFALAVQQGEIDAEVLMRESGPDGDCIFRASPRSSIHDQRSTMP